MRLREELVATGENNDNQHFCQITAKGTKISLIPDVYPWRFMALDFFKDKFNNLFADNGGNGGISLKEILSVKLSQSHLWISSTIIYIYPFWGREKTLTLIFSLRNSQRIHWLVVSKSDQNF